MRPVVRRVDRLQRLAVFEAAARTGSFSAAAADLGMTQPAVTRQIRQLERSLGVDLFVRSANRSSLTDAGYRLHQHVNAGFDVIESGLGELDEHGGQFVLAAHPGIAQQCLVPHLDDVMAALGDLELRLWLFDRDADLHGSDFDAAIRVGTGDFSGQSSHRLFAERVVPVASPTLAEAWSLGPGSSADDVYRAPFVHMDDGASPWMTWSEWLAEFGITLRRSSGRVLFHNYPMVLQQALAGRGVALGWRHLIDDLIEGGALTIVGPEVTSRRAYFLTWPQGPPSPAVVALRDYLDRRFVGD